MHQNHILSGLRLDPTALPRSPISRMEVGLLFLSTSAPPQKPHPLLSDFDPSANCYTCVIQLTLLLALLYRPAWLVPWSLTEMTVVCYCFCCQSFPDRVRRLARPKIRWLSRGHQLRQRLAIDCAVTVWIRPVLGTQSQWTAWLLGHATRSRCGPNENG